MTKNGPFNSIHFLFKSYSNPIYFLFKSYLNPIQILFISYSNPIHFLFISLFCLIQSYSVLYFVKISCIQFPFSNQIYY